MCSDEDQDGKCPSGCRLQGFIDEADGDVYQHLSKICEKVKQYKTASSSTIIKTTQFYETQKKIIIKKYMDEMRYTEVAEMLHRNLTLLWKRSTDLSKELQKYHRQIEDQINEIQQLEVDIDIKLRACKGSCRQTFDHMPDYESFRSMRDKMATFDLTSTKQKTFTLDKKLTLQPVIQPQGHVKF